MKLFINNIFNIAVNKAPYFFLNNNQIIGHETFCVYKQNVLDRSFGVWSMKLQNVIHALIKR